jgi:hypothetical protein
MARLCFGIEAEPHPSMYQMIDFPMRFRADAAWHPHPVMSGQTAVMAPQVLHGPAVGGDWFVEMKLRKVLVYRFSPVESAFVHQHVEAHSGERFGDCAEDVLHVYSHRQTCLDAALAVDVQRGRRDT